jgi:hypothetical protein
LPLPPPCVPPVVVRGVSSGGEGLRQCSQSTASKTWVQSTSRAVKHTLEVPPGRAPMQHVVCSQKLNVLMCERYFCQLVVVILNANGQATTGNCTPLLLVYPPEQGPCCMCHLEVDGCRLHPAQAWGGVPGAQPCPWLEQQCVPQGVGSCTGRARPAWLEVVSPMARHEDVSGVRST